MCLQDLSTAWNILAAAGNCLTMSGDPKIDSRYIHVRWHACHSSKVSWDKDRKWWGKEEFDSRSSRTWIALLSLMTTHLRVDEVTVVASFEATPS